ncbi:MAG: PSD1 and planctomycete cytochrome C domain-containing protein [Planctomycetota bacterium]|nr:PSD1 and planctomycete cytochrome C domain-containing protein [Planctomycetota bacterium]
MNRFALLAVSLSAISLVASGRSARSEDDSIDFSRDIRPILSNNCFACHGPDEKQRKGGFRLDEKTSALGKGESGEPVIVPGKAEASELVARILSDDPDLRMPPAASNKHLTREQIELLKKWVATGADWQEHWAFVAPKEPAKPKLSNPDWVRNPIDWFILKKLEQSKLAPSRETTRETLIRRVTFDLSGLPPTLAEVDAFLKDDSPQAYEKLVDRLLTSPAFGEHMARFWLDAARYGDTHGLHLDNYREMWAYRDWVVNAFNSGKPYNEFIIEQLAGDLIPNATDDQLIATGFNRCHVTTGEGGSIQDEVYVRNVVDRVVTTGTVFMGMTFDCTRCHDHKYDPFTQKDFYSMFAFFNSIDGNAMDGNKKDHAPALKVFTNDQKQRISDLEKQIDATQQDIQSALASFKYVEPENPTELKLSEPTEFVWVDDAVPAGANAQGDTPWKFVSEPKPVSGKTASTRTATGRSQHFFDKSPETLKIAEGDVFFCYVYLDPKNPPKEIMLQWNDGNWEHRARWGGNQIPWGKDNSPSRINKGDLPKAGEWVRLEVPAKDVGLNAGAQVNGWAFTQFDGTVHWDKAGVVSSANQKPLYDSLVLWDRNQKAANGGSLPADVKAIVLLEAEKRNADQKKQLQDYFVEHVFVGSRDQFGTKHKMIADSQTQLAAVRNAAATTLVFREKAESNPSFMLTRGEYDKRGEQVARGTPSVLPPMPKDAPLNRLGFAQWLTDPSHPLTARVTVNRLWQQMFGVGLVKTSEDFGSQGEPPSHPQLLDWLAVTFQADGWNVKKMMKRIVMSATYRQSSTVTPALTERDPENRLLARGPRFRLDAEMLRDQALDISGLLNRKMGGPSVKPPQPDGLWFAVGYSGSDTVRFKADTGSDKVHRRTLYTFIKKTAPPPQMSIIDAPSREACAVRRERTNTPLLALLLLNDPQYFECARMLAERTLREGGQAPKDRLQFIFRLSAGRLPSDSELNELTAILTDLRKAYSKDAAGAAKLLGVAVAPEGERASQAQLAAWVNVANLILNLAEVLTKS